MSNFLTNVKIGNLQTELNQLEVTVADLILGAGLQNPLDQDITGNNKNITGVKDITAQTIETAGHATFNSATVTETLNVGFLTTTEVITAAAGLKTDNISENIAGAGIAITGSVTISELNINTISADPVGGTISVLSDVTFDKDVTVSGTINLGDLSVSDFYANTIQAKTAGFSLQFNSPITSGQAITTTGVITGRSLITNGTGGITAVGDITSQAGVSANTLFANTSIITDGTITAGAELDTQNLKTNTIEAFSTPSVTFFSPITSTQNITTTGEVSAATLALTGALTVDDIEIQTINFDSKRAFEIFGNLTVGTGAAINGTTPTNPYQAQYNINNVAALSASSVGSNQLSTNVILPNPNASPNPTGTVIVAGNLQLTNPNVTSNYNITGANTIGMLAPGVGIATDTKIRSAPTPTVGTGCLQVSSTVNGTPGTWGTVYDTVYNIPPSVGTVTLEEVLTAGSIAVDKTMTIAGVLLSDGDDHTIEIFTGGTPTTGPTLAVTQNNGVSVGNIYDTYYYPLSVNYVIPPLEEGLSTTITCTSPFSRFATFATFPLNTPKASIFSQFNVTIDSLTFNPFYNTAGVGTPTYPNGFVSGLKYFFYITTDATQPVGSSYASGPFYWDWTNPSNLPIAIYSVFFSLITPLPTEPVQNLFLMLGWEPQLYLEGPTDIGVVLCTGITIYALNEPRFTSSYVPG